MLYSFSNFQASLDSLVLDRRPLNFIYIYTVNMKITPFLLLGILSATYAMPALRLTYESKPAAQALQRLVHNRKPAGPIEYEYVLSENPGDLDKKLGVDENRALNEEIQDWVKDLIEHRIFKAALGVTVELRRTGNVYDYVGNPRRFQFKLRTRDLSVVVHNEDWYQGIVTSKLLLTGTTEDEPISATQTPCIVEVQFRGAVAAVIFKNDERYHVSDTVLGIRLTNKDMDLFRRFDAFAKTVSRTLTPSPPLIPSSPS
ncbi:hypothetical protein EV361DRAFT_952128 [Lentinula raphanica]|nr:hypothetical protein F5880DRAFT_1509684 [Lentinula raphanica]KAJ3968693.1 hypothetical protein EV361DRAFT_952128 [Lentinula raphanica]